MSGSLPGRTPPAAVSASPAPVPKAFPAGHLAWSASRRRLLEECERAYYWRYLGARSGWKAPAGSEARRAWTLKHLTAVPLLTGTAVHTAARQLLLCLRDGRTPPTAAAALAAARMTLRQVWLTSVRQPDRFWSMPGVYTAFLEVIYRGALSDREAATARERLAVCIDALYAMPLLDDLAVTPSAQLLISDGTPSWFTTNAGGVVWVDLDLAYVHRGETPVGDFPAGVPVIADFKTGAPHPEEERIALAAYALYLRDVVGWAPADGVYLGRVIYLGLSRERWVVIGADELGALEGLVAEDLARMKRLLVDPSQGLARAPQAYALATNRSACRHCAFLELCRPEIGDRPWEQRP